MKKLLLILLCLPIIGFGQYNSCKLTDKRLEQSLIGHTIKVQIVGFANYTHKLLANGRYVSYRDNSTVIEKGKPNDRWWVSNNELNIYYFEFSTTSIPLTGSMKYGTWKNKTPNSGTTKVLEFDYVLPSTDISTCIKQYIDERMNDWLKQGEFEKTVSFQKRVNESTRKDKLEKYRKEAIEHFKKEAIKSVNYTDISLEKYNPDIETFLINISRYGNFNLPVPISKAPSFKKNFNASNFSNLDLILEDDKFIVSHFEIDGYTYDVSGNGIYNKCIGDCQNGYGTYTAKEGIYKGHWKDGRVHGKGIFEGSEYTYDGEYVNGKQHGQGKKTYTNGTIEEGLFENGEFVGE
jgi:hypothetical protein